MNKSATQSFKTASAIGPRLRVKLIDTQTVALAGAGEVGCGITDQGSFAIPNALGGYSYTETGVCLFGCEGTFEATADGAIAQFAEFYGGASGKISATPLGAPAGRTRQAATADGDIIEVDFYQPGKVVVTDSLLAASVDKYVFIADGPMRVAKISALLSVAGSDGSAVTLDVRKITAAGTALPGDAAGATVKELLTSAISLKSTAGTEVVGTLTATGADLILAAGDKLAFNFTGTLTALVGIAKVEIARL